MTRGKKQRYSCKTNPYVNKYGQRQRICRTTKSGKKSCVYGLRDCAGKFVDIQNINRTIKMEAVHDDCRCVKRGKSKKTGKSICVRYSPSCRKRNPTVKASERRGYRGDLKRTQEKRRILIGFR